MREITAFACDYCKKYSKSKPTMKSHEKICYGNPATKSCASCIHYGQEAYNEGYMTRSRPVCMKGERLFFETDNGLEVRLRNNCEKWEERQQEE